MNASFATDYCYKRPVATAAYTKDFFEPEALPAKPIKQFVCLLYKTLTINHLNSYIIFFCVANVNNCDRMTFGLTMPSA